MSIAFRVPTMLLHISMACQRFHMLKTCPALTNNCGVVGKQFSTDYQYGDETLQKKFASPQELDPRKRLPSIGDKAHKIYEGALSAQLKRLKLFSMSSSALGIFMQPVLLAKVEELGKGPLVASMTIICFFTFGTPFLIHLLSKRYVTEIIYNPIADKYTAATYSFFLRRKEIEFTVDDITAPEVPGPFTTFLIKSSRGKLLPVFTMDTCFLHLEHYGRFMRFDKPVDLRLGNSESREQKS